MSFVTAIKNIGIRAGRAVVAHTPEILMGLGTIGVVGGTVLIAKASSKLEDELSDIKDAQKDIIDRKEEYTDDKTYKKDLLMIKKAAALKVAKLFAPGVALTAAGIVCFFAAFGKVKKENGILAASLAAANKALEDYRARVVEDLGADKDLEYMYGLKKEKIQKEVVDENGEKKIVEEEVLTSDGSKAFISRYAIRFTPEFSTEANTDINYNRVVLEAAQRDFNRILAGRKKVFLNEIYERLGIDETSESRRAGWIYGKKGGDGKIHFIIIKITVKDVTSPLGYHEELIVDFNVDGDIMSTLPKNPSLLGMEVDDHISDAVRIVEF